MSAVIDDGWGDDDDLDISGDNLEEDGWGDDEGLGVSSSNVADGWGDDDDFFNDDDSDKDFPLPAPEVASADSALSRTKSSDSTVKLEDQELTVDRFGRQPVGDRHSHAIQSQVTTLAPPLEPPRDQPTHAKVNPNTSKLVSELSHYIDSLDRMLSSINAVLEFEYNTFQKAEELVEYYQSRPQLAEYTRTKELARMDYEIFLPYGHVETNKERIIADNLLPDHAIVSRAANQSLLADLLQVITGQDLIVRPQYMTICIATWCKFTIHQGDNGADMVDCRAKLSLSMPTSEGDRLPVAEVAVCVLFSPARPMVEFKVQKIDILLDDYSKLTGVAAFLNEMEGNNGDDEFVNVSPDMYRDAFLEKSQRLLSLSSVGMMSAFQQVDSVVNIKGKIKRISSFIPDTDQLLEVEQETMAFAEARKEAMHQRKQQELSATSFPRPPPPPPPPPPENALQGNSIERPKSILGGLVRSGWKTLSNSVALPDEDPAIYGEPAPPPPPPPVALYNKPIEPIPLYRKEGTANHVSRKLSNQVDSDTLNEQDSKQGNPINTTMERPQIGLGRGVSPNTGQQYNDGFDRTDENKTSDRDSFPLDRLPMSDPNIFGGNTHDEVTGIEYSESRIQNSSPEPEEMSRFHEKTNVRETNDEDENEDVVEDGWDDFGFDDDDDVDDDDGTGIDDNTKNVFDRPKTPEERCSEDETCFGSSDDGIASSPTQVSATNGKGNPEELMFATRKRWVNPRPYRPYVKG